MNLRRILTIPVFLLLSLLVSNSIADGQEYSINQPAQEKFREISLPIGIDLDATYISREPRYRWDSPKPWPEPGENVTFKAHIINKGTIGSGTFTYEWKIDDQILSNGSGVNLLPQEEAIIEFDWEWQSGRHYVSFKVDPVNLIAETSESNNIIKDATDAMAIEFWVEETVYDDFNNIQNGGGTYSWEDWAQRIIQKMNWIFEFSKYPAAPNGVLTRVRLDNITIVPDGTLFNQGPWHAPFDTTYDGRWGFSVEEYGNGCQCCPQNICYDMPKWVIHELMHYLYARIDLYAFDVQGGDVGVRDEYGSLISGTALLPYVNFDVLRYADRYWDMMHSPDNMLFSDYIVYSLNFDWPLGKRTHRTDWEHYFLKLPSETRIRVLDNNDQPIKDVQAAAYQAVPGDGSSGPYSQFFDNNPDILGITKTDGTFSLGGRPFGDLEQYGTPVGVLLIKLTHPTSGQNRYVWLEVSDLNMAYWRGSESLYIHDVHFPSGPQKLSVSEDIIEFTAFQGSNPAPKNIDVNILGEGVQYWSIEPSTESWIRTLPDPEITNNNSEYPAGTMTLIIESSDLPIGSYTTNIIVRADEIINSPQTITVNLDIVESPSPSTISGFVKNLNGKPISGVVIGDEFGHTDTSDVNGDFAFSNLPAGTYTFTPYSTDYEFKPGTQMVTVPPDAFDVNFIIEEDLLTFLPLTMRNFSRGMITTTIFGEEDDGEVLNNPCENWENCRNSSLGTSIWQGLEMGTIGSIFTGSHYMVARSFLLFDTSSIPSNANIIGATLNLYAGQYQNGNKTLHVVPSSASFPLSVEDFSKIEYVSGGSKTPSSPFIWMQIPLNLSALSWIQPGNTTQFALVHDYDFRNITPTEPNDVLIALAEDGEHKPFLSITYEVP